NQRYDGTTIRLTSSKAAGHTFTLSQQEDEVGLKPTKGLTSGQGRFFVDCGGNPLTNIYSDLQRLRKKSGMPHNPPRRRCDGPSPRSAGLATPPAVQDVVRGRVAPLGAPTSSQSPYIRSISEQSWRGLAVRDFGGRRAK
ncbi:hypothetical protein KUCAC02_023579, partial [Chaenocephalus aceratus]